MPVKLKTAAAIWAVQFSAASAGDLPMGFTDAEIAVSS